MTSKIMEFGAIRFNALQRYIGNISVNTLNSVLKALDRVSNIP